ncbi:hypothetical protein [Nonomuraea roseoviolacea]|uniref:NYN domain-containing protein n=1 Tax=Nonomuraea roseoviolacea subsp. carminata TaxID=160689 RepID=A0ABT1K0R8_9ACTN|nr:hypothetical protein [Nonomuraea roseoviolacea]MCP2347596.1 hypothetical protein [Nonomuraea roseoviolacea subsp. carminata]
MRTLRAGRAIHLLDIENLAASPTPAATEIAHTMSDYLRRVPVGPLDQFVVGVNPRSLAEVGRVIHGAQILTRSGPDGADSVLTEMAVNDRIDLRFERVVIGSGDGYFADLATWLTAHDVQVTVVSRTGLLSWRLYVAVRDITYLDAVLAA